MPNGAQTKLGGALEPATTIADAIRIASTFHQGQFDKSGRPYLGHLERTAGLVHLSGGDWTQEAAAWLHDIVEDTDCTLATLEKVGMPHAVISIVEAMTHFVAESNGTYWRRLTQTPSAILVKLCDIYDNLDPRRMCYLPEETQIRLRKKYAQAILALDEVKAEADREFNAWLLKK
jgi:(p)ppGpp synthase/HD superfamily hydrolase